MQRGNASNAGTMRIKSGGSYDDSDIWLPSILGVSLWAQKLPVGNEILPCASACAS